jgi:hypothetical protein
MVWGAIEFDSALGGSEFATTLSVMNHLTRNSARRAALKNHTRRDPAPFFPTKKSLIKPAFISPLAILCPSGWRPPGMIDSSLAKNHFLHHPKREKQKANVLSPPPGSFNH